MMHDCSWKSKQTLHTEHNLLGCTLKNTDLLDFFSEIWCADVKVLKPLSSREDEISPHNLSCVPGMVGLWLPARDRLGRVLLPLHSSKGLNFSGHDGGGSENIESRFSGNLCPPCRHRFQRSVLTVRPGSVQFPVRFGAAGNQDEVLELSAAFSISLSDDSAPWAAVLGPVRTASCWPPG